MKQIKTLLAALFVAMAGTASAQTKNYVHITLDDNSVVHYSQDRIQSMIIDTNEPLEFVTFTDGTNTVTVANMNLGATTVADSPETSYGNYYAWGATETFATVDQSTGTVTPTTGHDGGYSQDNAPFRYGNAYTKYQGEGEGKDGLKELEAEDDAVAANMPGWHMPTQAEIQTLFAACGGSGSTPTGTISTTQASYPSTGIYWVTGGNAAVKIGGDTYSVNGMLFVQDADHHVFFPAAGGVVNGTYFFYAGNRGYYWSSSLYESFTDFAYYLIFNSDGVRPDNTYHRYVGFTVRPFKD